MFGARGVLRSSVATLALVGGTLLTAVVAQAPTPSSAGVLATVTVDNAGDTAAPAVANCLLPPAGNCTLRDAIEGVANGTDADVEVIIPADVGDIVLTVGQLFYNGGPVGDRSLTISGGGNVIDQQEATGTDRVLQQTTTLETLTISGVTITGGGASIGSGIFIVDGGLFLDRVTVTGNDAGANFGGGIMLQSGGPITIVDSTISDNGANNNAGIMANGSVLLVNSTVSDNVTRVAGVGGITVPTLTLVYSTVVGNTGVASAANVNVGTLNAFGSVVALASGGLDCDTITTVSSGYNWDGDDSCGFDQPTDNPGAGNPELGALADNGGPTLTRAPAETSGLVDDIPGDACGDGDTLAGFAVTTDQRGEPRPDPQRDACDIGAVELQQGPPPTTTTTTTTPPAPPPGPPTPSPIFVTPRFTG